MPARARSAVWLEAVEGDAPRQRSDDKDAAVGCEHAAELVIRLLRGDGSEGGKLVRQGERRAAGAVGGWRGRGRLEEQDATFSVRRGR